jgi:Zn-dependent protease
MKEITLFIFGGVAHMEEDPPSPKAEFMIAVVGPLSSFGLALLRSCSINSVCRAAGR